MKNWPAKDMAFIQKNAKTFYTDNMYVSEYCLHLFVGMKMGFGGYQRLETNLTFITGNHFIRVVKSVSLC